MNRSIYLQKLSLTRNDCETNFDVLSHYQPDGTPATDEKYYLLSEVLPQDYELRKNLHLKHLEEVLKQHQFERTDRAFKRECLHCRDVIEPTRACFIEHLFTKHFLQLGKSENLVFIDELIDLVQQKLDQLICLFCSKTFKDRPTLKEHMRKKGHKRINPENKSFDKFFLVNYKNEMHNPKSDRHTPKQSVQSAMLASNGVNTARPSSATVQTESDSDSDWSDWEGEKQNLNCLFCSANDTDFATIKNHMKTNHDFDFEAAISGLNFYEKVKVVNYMRRQMHMLKCVTCDSKFVTIKLLQDHLTSSKHYGIGDKVYLLMTTIQLFDLPLKFLLQKDWDHPEFFFPTYEDDSLLCYLDDPNDNSCADEVVVPEEQLCVPVNPEIEKLSRD